MAAAIVNLDVEQGATFSKLMTWYQEDGISVIDMTGCTAKSQWRTSVDDPTVLMELSTENGRISIDVPKGQIKIHLTKDETAALTFTSCVYDLEVFFSEVSGETYSYRLCRGKVKLSKSITR